RRLRHALDHADAAFGVDERAFFFAPGCGGQDDVRERGGLGVGVHVLYHETLQARAHVLQTVLIDPRVSRVGPDHPARLDLPRQDLLDDLVVRQTHLVWNAALVDAQELGDLAAVLGVLERPAGEQSRGVAEDA